MATAIHKIRQKAKLFSNYRGAGHDLFYAGGGYAHKGLPLKTDQNSR